MIPYAERRAIYEHAIDAWGIDVQVIMVLEEMSELQKEICKNYRGKQNRDAIAEEIADVTIMLEQLRLIYGVNDDVNDWIERKVLRLAGRLEAGT